MYLVLSEPNARDTTAACVVPRCITDNAANALKEARKAYEGGDRDFIAQVIIYDIAPEKSYDLEDFVRNSDIFRRPIVFLANHASPGGHFNEKFFKDFKQRSEE